MPEGRNLARAREGWEAFNRGDVDTMLDFLHPDVVWEENDERGFLGLDPVYRGHDGFRRWLLDVLEAWDVIQAESNEYLEVGPSSVILVSRFNARGRKSGVTVDQTFYNLFDMRAGKAVRRRVFADRDHALQAARSASERP